MSPKERDALQTQIKELLLQGFIEPASSPFGALAPEKTGEFRMYVDYRALNKLTVKNRYPGQMTYLTSWQAPRSSLAST